MSQNRGRNSHQKRELKSRLFGTRKVARCCFCSRSLSFEEATLEHVIPLAQNGGWDRFNLSLSCYNCNQERGEEDFASFKNYKRSKRVAFVCAPALLAKS